MEELLKKIGQLQYEISCLELDEETLTGVTIRTDELKELIKQGQTLPIDSVIVPKGTLCISCQKEPATNGIGNRKTLCSKCWNKIAG